jgi:hypothetical protein
MKIIVKVEEIKRMKKRIIVMKIEMLEKRVYNKI